MDDRFSWNLVPARCSKQKVTERVSWKSAVWMTYCTLRRMWNVAFFFYIFRPIWMKFGTEYICRIVCENACGERRYLHAEWSKCIVVLVIFYICYQIWVRTVCASCIQSSWALFWVRENRDREGPAFPTNVSGTRVRVCAVEQRYSDNNEHLGDFCSASRREQSRSLVKFIQLNHLTDRLYCCIICVTVRLFL